MIKQTSVMAVILIGALLGGVIYMMPEFANSQNTDYAQYDRSNEIRYRIERLNERIWQLQSRLNRYPEDNDAKEELNRLLNERESLLSEVNNGGNPN